MRLISYITLLGATTAMAFGATVLSASANDCGSRMRQHMESGAHPGRGMGMGYDNRGHMRGGRFGERFAVVDANDDGKVSDEEAAAQREDVFVAMDVDDSGDLTLEEYMAVRMGPGEGFNEDRRKAHEDTKKSRFEPMDSDKSGTVSKAEFMAEGEARFAAADADQDGVVTPWEFRAHRN